MPDDDTNSREDASASGDKSRSRRQDARIRKDRAAGSDLLRPGNTAGYRHRKPPRHMAGQSRERPSSTHPARRAQDRYRAYQQQHSHTPSAASPRAHALPAGPLASAFQRAEQEQLRVQKRPGNRLRNLPKKRWFWPVIGIPGVLLLVAMIIVSPVLYQSFNAWRNVQVDSVEHIESAFVPQLNQAGTPELVQASDEMSNTTWSGTERITVLLLGVDKADNGASRTDTLILVNIDPVEKTASMLSIPRDLKVVIPGYGVDKINAAFALGEFNEVQGGGAGLTIRTIEANLGIPVAAFVQIDFNGFIKMIDTVGGITIDVPYPIKDDTYPAENFRYQRIYFPTGWQHLDGDDALMYARTRHQDGDSRRSVRQQQVLLALRDQAMGLDLIPQLPTLIRQFGDSVRTDISVNDAVRLARLGTGIPRESITQTSLLPTLYEEYGTNGTYYLSADWDMMGDVLSEFSGTYVNPPGAALANADYSLPILVENGTDNPGLAGRISETLQAEGFWNIQITDASDHHESTTVADHQNNLGTAALITHVIGISPDSISQASSSGMTSSNGYAITITIGDDAPDPAGDEWNLRDYQREEGTGDDTNSIATPGATVTPTPVNPTERQEIGEGFDSLEAVVFQSIDRSNS